MWDSLRYFRGSIGGSEKDLLKGEGLKTLYKSIRESIKKYPKKKSSIFKTNKFNEMNSDYLNKYCCYRRNRSSAASLYGNLGPRSSSAPVGGAYVPSPHAGIEDVYEDISNEPCDYAADADHYDDQDYLNIRKGRVGGFGRPKPSFSGSDYQGTVQSGRRGRTAASPAESKGEQFDYEAADKLQDEPEPFSGRKGRVGGYAGRSKPSFSGTDYQGVTGRRGQTAPSPAESKTSWSLMDEFSPASSFDSSLPGKTTGRSHAGDAGMQRSGVKSGGREQLSLFEICRDLEIDVRH